MDLLNLKEKTTMKTSLLIFAIVASALAAPIASAQDRSAPAKPTMNMDKDQDKQMVPMQENMTKMQQQMDKIAATTDPKDRQKLMQEHMQTMQETMKAMRSMGGPTMKGGGMAMGDKKGGAMSGGDVKTRQEGMEKRMDMMQMMMEQMMQRDPAAKPMGHM